MALALALADGRSMECVAEVSSPLGLGLFSSEKEEQSKRVRESNQSKENNALVS